VEENGVIGEKRGNGGAPVTLFRARYPVSERARARLDGGRTRAERKRTGNGVGAEQARARSGRELR